MTPLDPDTLTLGGLFVAGLATSLHCAGMCGLLTCGLGISSGPNQAGSITGYHAGRLISYASIGAIAGAIGFLPLSKLGDSINLVPWFLILFLVFIGLGLERFLPSLPSVSKWINPIRQRFARSSGPKKGIVMGLATPLLPCGPLYAMLAMGFLSGSPVRGAELMLVFSLGTIPLLWLMQSGSGFWQRKISPRNVQRLQRGVALIAALALAWRFRGGLPFIDGPAGCGCEIAWIIGG